MSKALLVLCAALLLFAILLELPERGTSTAPAGRTAPPEPPPAAPADPEPSDPEPAYLDCGRLAALGFADCPTGMATVGWHALAAAGLCGMDRARLGPARMALRARMMALSKSREEAEDVFNRMAGLMAVREAAATGAGRTACPDAERMFRGLERALDLR